LVREVNVQKKLLLLTFLALAVLLTSKANAGGPWSDQYCNLTTETVIVKDTSGKIIDKQTVEKVKCEDGAMDFLHGAKIAKSCRVFNWDMPLGGTQVTQRSISCKRLDGGYEIVPGYHSVE
jgi:hypothetical protein